jgi:CheY-like chemotaxis protein
MRRQALLYVEDEDNDVIMLQFALKKLQDAHPLKVVQNGEEAVAYLDGGDKYADRTQYPLPALVLLDLNTPRLSGMKVLQWIRGQPQFASLPVVIYTSSENPTEMAQARQLGANDFIVKPSGIPEIMSVVQKLTERWLDGS